MRNYYTVTKDVDILAPSWLAERIERHIATILYRTRDGHAAVKDVAMQTGSDIINSSVTKEDTSLHIVGKIDRNIYRCITEDITTDEVIITDERIQHIKDRHPNDYEKYYEYLKCIVEAPDYIVETNKPDTALILKEIVMSDEKQFKTVLRLKTSKDKPEFKNSIITFMKINEKEWSRLLRNKQVLYKKE